MNTLMKKKSVMHGHTCIDCGHLWTCLAIDCPIRATERESTFKCGCVERKNQESTELVMSAAS
jgi:hypothetical protein